jgi:hypothetical protein
LTAIFRANPRRIAACDYAGGCDKIHVSAFVSPGYPGWETDTGTGRATVGKVEVGIDSGVDGSQRRRRRMTDAQIAAESQAMPIEGRSLYGPAAGGGYDVLDGYDLHLLANVATEPQAMTMAVDAALTHYVRQVCYELGDHAEPDASMQDYCSAARCKRFSTTIPNPPLTTCPRHNATVTDTISTNTQQRKRTTRNG